MICQSEYDYIPSFSVKTFLVNSNVVKVITGGIYSHSYLFFILRLWEEPGGATPI